MKKVLRVTLKVILTLGLIYSAIVLELILSEYLDLSPRGITGGFLFLGVLAIWKRERLKKLKWLAVGLILLSVFIFISGFSSYKTKESNKNETVEIIKKGCTEQEGANEKDCDCIANRLVDELTTEELNKFPDDEGVSEKVFMITEECVLNN